jgi:hypothetical protein
MSEVSYIALECSTNCWPHIRIPQVRERDFAMGADDGADGERVECVHGGIVLLPPGMISDIGSD